jgi:hypothetical protein
MASALIEEVGTVSGNQMRMARPIEAAGQTFLAGTPVQLTSGAVQAMATAATSLLGIAKEFGAGLATAGVPLGVPSPPAVAGALPPEGGGIKFGSVPNMPGAKNLLRPYFNDGRTGVILAIPDTVFYAQVGPAAAAPTAAMVGTQAGLTIDTDGHWYVNPGATQMLVVVTGLAYWDAARGVLFTFLPNVAQLPS